MSCALVGNKHLLHCDDMWQKLLKHFDNKGCIADAKQFLPSRNRVIDKKRRSQQNNHGGQSQQKPYTAREQQFRNPRQQSQQSTQVNYRQRTGSSHGEHRPNQGPQRGSPRSGGHRQDT